MFAAGEKSGDFAGYCFRGIVGNVQTGYRYAPAIFTQLEAYNFEVCFIGVFSIATTCN